MNFVYVADQREIGQHKPAGGFLQTAFFGPTFNDRTDERSQLQMLAVIVRKLSDNFIPENFVVRDIKDKHPDCLETILQGNVKAVTKFSQHLDGMNTKGLLNSEESESCAEFLAEENARLVTAALLVDSWKRSYSPTSQQAPESP